MFASMVKSKILKSKISIDNAQLNQQPRRTQSSAPPLKKTESQNISSQPSLTPGSNNQAPKQKPLNTNEFELKSLIYNSKKYENNEITFRMKQDGFEIDFSDEQRKCRLEIKKSDCEKKMQIKKQENYFQIKAKKITQKKEDLKSRTLINENILKEQTLYLYPKNKEVLNHMKGNPGFIQSEQKTSLNDSPDDSNEFDVVKFALPTTARLVETEKMRRNIKEMKEQDKNIILMEVFKIKKEYEDTNEINRKFKCPVFSCEKCQKPYRDAQQLKAHLKTKHQQLARHGIELTEYDGSFQYSNKALDLALFLGKEYPSEMKKIIKKMKTKVPVE